MQIWCRIITGIESWASLYMRTIPVIILAVGATSGFGLERLPTPAHRREHALRERSRFLVGNDRRRGGSAERAHDGVREGFVACKIELCGLLHNLGACVDGYSFGWQDEPIGTQSDAGHE